MPSSYERIIEFRSGSKVLTATCRIAAIKDAIERSLEIALTGDGHRFSKTFSDDDCYALLASLRGEGENLLTPRRFGDYEICVMSVYRDTAEDEERRREGVSFRFEPAPGGPGVWGDFFIPEDDARLIGREGGLLMGHEAPTAAQGRIR